MNASGRGTLATSIPSAAMRRRTTGESQPNTTKAMSISPAMSLSAASCGGNPSSSPTTASTLVRFRISSASARPPLPSGPIEMRRPRYPLNAIANPAAIKQPERLEKQGAERLDIRRFSFVVVPPWINAALHARPAIAQPREIVEAARRVDQPKPDAGSRQDVPVAQTQLMVGAARGAGRHGHRARGQGGKNKESGRQQNGGRHRKNNPVPKSFQAIPRSPQSCAYQRRHACIMRHG